VLGDLAASFCLTAGGVLWALTPLGIHLSEIRFKTPEVFWKLFPSAPLLLGLGLVALCLGRTRLGRLGKIGAGVALLGVLLVVAGDVGLFYLRLDDLYIVTAPSWRTLRLGLIFLCAGSALFGVATAREKTIPLWGFLPLAMASLGGLVAVLGDRGSFGATLWAAFGLGWAWLGLALFAGHVLVSKVSRNT
jgi:hypothetical protein